MSEEEAQKVLDEMHNVRPEKLNGEAKRLFHAIMTIADERDNYKELYNQETEESQRVIKHLWDMVDELTQNEEKLKIELGKEKEKNTELRIKISARETVVEELKKELEQEKEKNKELEEENQKYPIKMTDEQYKDVIDLAQKDIKDELERQINTRIINEEFIEKNYISKDKIMEFIKEETKEGTYNFKSISAKRLKELLEGK